MVKLTVFCFLILSVDVSAEIKNGYGERIADVQRSLNGLLALRNGKFDLDRTEKRRISTKIKLLLDYITYYELTETLLKQFERAAPDIWFEITNVKDALGKNTDVFVKFIPRSEAVIQAAGTTNLASTEGDPRVYVSEFGERTVSIELWTVGNALEVLAHEFGHVAYQVPNLVSYKQFFRSNYINRSGDPNYLGHATNDPSGKSAEKLAQRFAASQLIHAKGASRHSPSFSTLFETIRKTIYSSYSL